TVAGSALVTLASASASAIGGSGGSMMKRSGGSLSARFLGIRPARLAVAEKRRTVWESGHVRMVADLRRGVHRAYVRARARELLASPWVRTTRLALGAWPGTG